MPDTPPEDAPMEDAVYDGDPGVEPDEFMSDLAAAMQPTDEDYASFDPQPDLPPAIDTDIVSSSSDEKEEKDDKLPEFDHRWREPFEGLLYLGHLSKNFTWMGHRFTIKTLNTDEVLAVGMIHGPFVGTLAEMKAYQAATTAACVVSVDGRPLSLPITNDPDDTLLQGRFDYIIKHWSPVVLNIIYEQYLLLEAKVNEVLAAMGKASG